MIKLILSMVVPIFVVGALSSYASPANQPISVRCADHALVPTSAQAS